MSLASLMVHTCNIETLTTSSDKDSVGGFTAPYVSKATGVACRFEKLKPDVTAPMYGKEDSTVFYRVYLISDQSLTIKDRLVFNGGYYLVRAVNNVDELGRLWQVDVEQPTD